MLSLDIGEVTFTKMQTYYSCPYRFYLRYIKHLQPKKNVFLEAGESIHKYIEDVLNGKQGYLDTSLLKRINLEKDKVYRYTEKLINFLKDKKFWVETKFETNLLEGILDLLIIKKDTAIIIDHKTSKKFYGDYLLQAKIYKHLVLKNLNVKNIIVIYGFIRKEEFYKINTFSIKLKEKITDFLQHLKEEKFYKNYSYLCKFCDFRDICLKEKGL